jgi:hypothetical protein
LKNCSVEKEFFKSYFCVHYAVGNCRVACPPTTTHYPRPFGRRQTALQT